MSNSHCSASLLRFFSSARNLSGAICPIISASSAALESCSSSSSSVTPWNQDISNNWNIDQHSKFLWKTATHLRTSCLDWPYLKGKYSIRFNRPEGTSYLDRDSCKSLKRLSHRKPVFQGVVAENKIEACLVIWVSLQNQVVLSDCVLSEPAFKTQLLAWRINAVLLWEQNTNIHRVSSQGATVRFMVTRFRCGR